MLGRGRFKTHLQLIYTRTGIGFKYFENLDDEPLGDLDDASFEFSLYHKNLRDHWGEMGDSNKHKYTVSDGVVRRHSVYQPNPDFLASSNVMLDMLLKLPVIEAQMVSCMGYRLMDQANHGQAIDGLVPSGPQ